jgi:hypothetical protein
MLDRCCNFRARSLQTFSARKVRRLRRLVSASELEPI